MIVRLDRIGDVILSTPVIKAVRDAYPKCYIAFMVRPYSKDIVDGNPHLDEVIVYDKRQHGKTLASNMKFAMWLRKKKFDTAIVLHPTSRSHIITALAGIPRRIGYDRKMGWLLTRRVPHTKQYGLRHEIDYALDLLKHAGISPLSRQMHMPINQKSERKVKEIFAQAGIGERDKVITINPGASCPSKRWSPENFAIAADRLAQDTGARIVIISGEKDKPSADRTASLMSAACLNLAGRTTVSDLASVLARSSLFVSNDSGPVHIACAVGTPVIAVFGRSDRGLSPDRWGPTGKRDIVLHKYVGCRKCRAHECVNGFACLGAVTPDEVAGAARRIMEDKT